ncbi:MAG: protein of unknown function with transrane region [Parcubacteria group bacterium]|nr:protein of unknown function with transrane region [Parcubacteria group bacterium]
MAKQTFRIEWDAHEYEHKERSADWYWAVGIVAVSGAIASIIFGNIIFGVLLLLSVFSLSLYINRPPETVHVVIDERGVLRGHVLYPYATLHSFWVDEEHSHPKIILRSQKTFVPLIIIPLGQMDGEHVREMLVKEIPEAFLSPSLVEKILEYFGF